MVDKSLQSIGTNSYYEEEVKHGDLEGLHLSSQIDQEHGMLLPHATAGNLATNSFLQSTREYLVSNNRKHYTLAISRDGKALERMHAL